MQRRRTLLPTTQPVVGDYEFSWLYDSVSTFKPEGCTVSGEQWIITQTNELQSYVDCAIRVVYCNFITLTVNDIIQLIKQVYDAES